VALGGTNTKAYLVVIHLEGPAGHVEIHRHRNQRANKHQMNRPASLAV
jgi:hypothetical protein